jgi:hypothetical protein
MIPGLKPAIAVITLGKVIVNGKKLFRGSRSVAIGL